MAFAVATAALAADKTKSEEAFDRLAALKGEWKGQTDGVDTTLMYTLTANGSALMEQCRPDKGREMITMFTVDGDHLIATHYCSARNQPQMATAAITDAQKLARRFSQYRPQGDPGRQRSSDSRMVLSAQGQDREKHLLLHTRPASSGLTLLRE
ncbi:MAG: hypothetical protein DMF73_10360 [Acidobacteria bacterium]|nr:MAG: hypothetical protein DMF73_10360 [Acidobacteriota bacterium]